MLGKKLNKSPQRWPLAAKKVTIEVVLLLFLSPFCWRGRKNISATGLQVLLD